MWVQSSLHVGEYPVGLNIELLDAEARERTAAVLAWLTLETARGGCTPEGNAWHDYVGDLLQQHVEFSISGVAAPEGLDAVWWNQAIGLAFVQFVQQNALAPTVNQHLHAMQSAGGGDCIES